MQVRAHGELPESFRARLPGEVHPVPNRFLDRRAQLGPNRAGNPQRYLIAALVQGDPSVPRVTKDDRSGCRGWVAS